MDDFEICMMKMWNDGLRWGKGLGTFVIFWKYKKYYFKTLKFYWFSRQKNWIIKIYWITLKNSI